MDETQNGQLNLETGLEQFAQVYMPARNFAARTRQEYQSDLEDLAAFLKERQVLYLDGRGPSRPSALHGRA